LHDITSTFSCSTLILVLRWTRFADYVASNKRVIREWWIWKDLEGRGRGLILRYYPGIHLEGLRKTTKTLVRIPGLRAEVWTLVLTNTKSVTTMWDFKFSRRQVWCPELSCGIYCRVK
jgi:hypothetical protein